MARLDQGGPLTHGNVPGNTNQATELAETATQHAGLPSSVAGRLENRLHTAGTKMWNLAIPSDFLGYQSRQQPAVRRCVVHRGKVNITLL